MPYFKIEDLPDTVQHALPKRAQEIYRKAFNYAWDTHRDPASLPKGIERVALAAMVAWTAVKKEYEKKGKRWIRKKRKIKISKSRK